MSGSAITVDELMKLLPTLGDGAIIVVDDGKKGTTSIRELKLAADTAKELKEAVEKIPSGGVGSPATSATPAPKMRVVYNYMSRASHNLLDEKNEAIYATAMIDIYGIISLLFDSDDTKMTEKINRYHRALPADLQSTKTIGDLKNIVQAAVNGYRTAIGTPTSIANNKDFIAALKTTFDAIIPYFSKDYRISGPVGSSAPGAAVSSQTPTKRNVAAGFNFGKGGAPSLLEKLNIIKSELSNLPQGVLLIPLSPNEQARISKKTAELKKEILAIESSASYLSERRSNPNAINKDRLKINEEEYIINSAIEAIKNNNVPYQFTHPQGGVQQITDFRSLRKYILDYSNDPITLLLRLTDLNPISLDDFLPKIEDDKLTISRNEKGILVVNIDDDKVEMPNPLGNKNNRQEFSKKYKVNSCYGLGGDKSDAFCVSILNKCLASDERSLEECRFLFTSPEWEKIKAEGIKNSNIYLIKEFLLKIGYPRINDRFDTNIDSWFDIVKSRYSANDNVLGKIKTNDKLKEVIVDMVEKYNRINDLEKKSRSTSSRNFHLPMKGGDNMSIINSNLYELYGGLNQNIVNLPSLSPSQKVYNIFKELVKDQDITSKYRNFFDKMEKNIENQNYNIDVGVRQNFNKLLISFRQSEEKLNKLLQTMHNFAWFLGQTVNTSNLSEAEKKINETASEKLNKVLNEENINAYNAAREKLVNSLNRKSQKLISIAAGHPIILIANN